MPIDLRTTWNDAWANLGLDSNPERLFRELVDHYQESHRKYHGLQHLEECLATFYAARHLAERPAEVVAALFFHDAIYDPKSHDNEEQSAQWAVAELTAAGVEEEVAGRVRDMVLATKHGEPPTLADAQLVVDVDLAILGAPEERFAEYERQVREEYAFVPGWIFRRKRRAILKAFLERPTLYHTAHFQALLEEKARANLRRSIGG